jgi:repressor LexA
MNTPQDEKFATDRQLQVLREIAWYIDAYKFPPSFREIGDMVGIKAVHGVEKHIKVLEVKGLIEREPGKYRALRITDKGRGELAYL